MATKLEVIQHRGQVRDYIDIAALDRAGACTIEDGLRYHKQRYAPTVTYEETLRIARLATSPPPTDPDPAFDDHLTGAASHLAARRRAVLDWALQSGQRPRPTPARTPRPRTLTRHRGHAGGAFASRTPTRAPSLNDWGRFVPPTGCTGFCLLDHEPLLARVRGEARRARSKV